MRLRSELVSIPLRRPFTAAWGTLDAREILRVTLETEDGVVGHGEAAPLEPYDGVSVAAVRAALDAYGNVLADAPPDAEREELLRACLMEREVAHALAAVDIALWDVEARRAGVPVASLLHPRALGSIPVNATVAAADRAGAAADASRLVERGYGCLKVKAGLGDDAGRLAAIRAAAGPDVLLRVDANGAWESPDEALANLRALVPSGVELAEEPVHGVAALAAVRAESPVPVAMDETADDVAAIGSGATDLVCLKIARCGGITGLLRAAVLARAAGSEVYVASALDGPVGVAAAVHAAAALGAEAPLRHCGLATLELFGGGLDAALPVTRGAIAVPQGPGLLGGRGT
jgi:L-alanine-DL-glutamate epimerase-like enolase superfamily enzyme